MSHTRVLRGRQLGAVSREADRDHDLAPRRAVRYSCPKGHEFEVAFSDEATAPSVWECRQHGTASTLNGARQRQEKRKPVRTHWDMLLERRTRGELAELLAERLTALQAHRAHEHHLHRG